MKNIFIIFFAIFLFFSCSKKDDFYHFDIIGKSMYDKPFGDNIIYGHIVLNGFKYDARATYYANKALVYIIDNEIIIDYYFSDFLTYWKLNKISLGSDIEDVILKLGEPAFGSYHSGDELSLQRGINNNNFNLIYLMKCKIESKTKNSLKYEIYSRGYCFNFDGNKKLISVEEINMGI